MKNLVTLFVAIILIVANAGMGFAQNYIDNAEMPKLSNLMPTGTWFALNETNGNTATIGYSWTSFTYAGTTVSAWNNALLVTSIDGTPLFAQQLTATPTNLLVPSAVGFDDSGAAYFAVQFQDDLVINGITYSPMGIAEVAVIKYSSSGVYQSHVLIQATVGPSVLDLEVTSNGNIHMAGNFKGTLYVNNVSTGMVSLGGSTNALVLVVDSAGQFVSGHEIGVPWGSQNWCNAFTIEVDSTGADIVGGYFKGASCSFGGTYAITPAGQHDYFVAKYDGSTCEGVFKIGSGNPEDQSFHLALDGDRVFINCEVVPNSNFRGWDTDGTLRVAVSTLGGNQHNAVVCWMNFATGTFTSMGVLVSSDLDIGVNIVSIMNGEGWCEVQYNDTLFYDDEDLSQFLLNGGNALLSFDSSSNPTSVNDYQVSGATTLGVRSIESSEELFVAIQTTVSSVDLDFGPPTVFLPPDKRGITRYDCSPPVLPTIVTQPLNTEGCVDASLFVEITATDADTYQWYRGSSAISGATNSILWFSPAVLADNGDYFCELTSVVGSVNSDTVTVTLNPLPMPVITGDLSFCDGESTVLAAGAGGSYLWNTGATTQTIVVTTAGTYSVIVTNSDGCEGFDDVIVVVNPLPIATITGDTVICDGLTGTLYAGAGSSYLWNTGATTQTLPVSVAATYLVTVTNANGCEGFDDVIVVVNPLPIATITGDTVICDGLTGTLYAGAGSSYLWSTGATTQTLPVLIAGTYSVTVTNANGCEGFDDVIVVVNPLPTPVITGVNELCENTDGTYTTGSFSSYTWSIVPSSAGMILSGQGTGTLVVNWLDSGNVLLAVTNTNGCVGSTSFSVIVNEIPIANAGTDQSIAYGTSTTLDGSATGGDGTYAYSWTPASMVVDPTDSQTVTVALTTSQTFVLEVTDGNACVSTDDVFINVFGPLGIIPEANPDATCGNTQVQLSANPYGGTGNYTYSWTSNPAGFTSTLENPVDTPTATTTYICEVNDGMSTDTQDVTVTVYDEITTDAGFDMNLEIGQSLQLDGSYIGGSGDVTILWEEVSNSIPIDDPTILNPNAGPFPTTNGYYFSLTVIDTITGCEDTDTMFVAVTVGIGEANISHNIKIYPNPTSGNIFINTQERLERVSIMNITGSEVFHLEDLQETTQIDLSGLPTGLYFVKVQTTDGIFITRKVVKR